MRPALMILLLAAVAAWTTLAVGVHAILARGSRLLFDLARWLELEPDSVQWMADRLAEAAPLALPAAALVWTVGVAAIAFAAFLFVRDQA